MGVKATKIRIEETENDFLVSYRNVLDREVVVKISGRRGLFQDAEYVSEDLFRDEVYDHLAYGLDAEYWEQSAKDELRKLTDAIAAAAWNTKNTKN